MEKNAALAKNTVIISIGKICTQLISFILLPLYTKLLSTEEYGVVDMISTYVQLLLPIVIWQIDQALFRFMIVERDDFQKNVRIISTVTMFLLLQFMLFSIIYFVATRFVINEYALYLYLSVISLGVLNYGLQMARGYGDTVTYSVASFLCGVITIFLNVFFLVILHMRAEGMLLAGIIGNFIATLYIIVKDKVYKYIQIKSFDYNVLKKMLKYALPLIPNALIWWLVNGSDRSIVLFFLGVSANGVLAIAHKFPTLITMLYNIFQISWTESAALHLKGEDKDYFFSSVFDTVYRVFVAGTIGLVSVMPFIFRLVINSEYIEAYYQIPIYAIASFFNVVAGLYSVIYISEMKTGQIAKISLGAGVINIVIHLGLIREVGLYAASISSAVAFGAMAIYRAVDIKKYIKQKINWLLIISSILVFVMVFISYYSNSNALKVLSLVISITYAIVINWKTLKRSVQILLNKTRKK